LKVFKSLVILYCAHRIVPHTAAPAPRPTQLITVRFDWKLNSSEYIDGATAKSDGAGRAALAALAALTAAMEELRRLPGSDFAAAAVGVAAAATTGSAETVSAGEEGLSRKSHR
jgi:hypothetical protein